MSHLSHFLEHLPSHYTYIVLGVVIMFESMSIPLPAESLLIVLSLYASQTHHLSLEGIALSAIAGAIVGDNIGYLIGYHYGYALLEKYGPKIGLSKNRQILGRYLFRRYGGLAVFLGRFMAFLRLFVALLAGASRMPWPGFLFFNILGGIAWAGGYAFITYEIGRQIESLSRPIGLTLAAIAILAVGGGFFFLRHHEHKLTERALADEIRRKARLKRNRKMQRRSRTHDNHHNNDYHQ